MMLPPDGHRLGQQFAPLRGKAEQSAPAVVGIDHDSNQTAPLQRLERRGERGAVHRQEFGQRRNGRRLGPVQGHQQRELSVGQAHRAKRLVGRYYLEVVAGRRIDVLQQLVAPEFVGHDPAGAIMDRAGYFDAVAMLHEAFAQLVVSIDDQVAERDRVTTRWCAVGTHVGTFMGIAPTGRNVILTGIDIHRIEGDRLAELWEQLDLAHLLAQLL